MQLRVENQVLSFKEIERLAVDTRRYAIKTSKSESPSDAHLLCDEINIMYLPNRFIKEVAMGKSDVQRPLCVDSAEIEVYFTVLVFSPRLAGGQIGRRLPWHIIDMLVCRLTDIWRGGVGYPVNTPPGTTAWPYI